METPYAKMMKEQRFLDWISGHDLQGYKYPNSMLEEYDEEREKELCFEDSSEREPLQDHENPSRSVLPR